MHVLWHLKGKDICCEMSENTFRTIMDSFLPSNEGFVQINDARFDNSTAKFVKKDEIIGFDVPELPMLKYLERKE